MLNMFYFAGLQFFDAADILSLFSSVSHSLLGKLLTSFSLLSFNNSVRDCNKR